MITEKKKSIEKLNTVLNPDKYNSIPIEKQKQYAAARDSFWEYCKMINPKFFKDDRVHLREIAETLQALYESRIIKLPGDTAWRILELKEIKIIKEYEVCKKMMLNIPPRHGKSYTMSLFAQWMFGKRNENKVIAVTYNEILAGRFSTSVRDGIDATKIDETLNIFSDAFPNVKIKDGDAAKQIWALNGQFFNYLGTGFGGTITGVGCNIGIIDDPVKNDKEAFNATLLENQWKWYTDTFLSRIEEGGIQIIIMTRWSTKDLCGRLMQEEPQEWYELKMKACLDEKKQIMLCSDLLTYKTYAKKENLTSAAIMEANYQQMPVDLQGVLYGDFKTYTVLPRKPDGKLAFEKIIAYTDTADTGSDYLCLIIAGLFQGYLYILDVYYTKEPMEKTEHETAKKLVNNNANEVDIESNNGGRGFARAVERILWNVFKTRRITVKWFHQSQNKQARILSNSTAVNNLVIFPVDWSVRWREYYNAMITYQREGKNKNDDAPDATTGLVEKTTNKSGGNFVTVKDI